MLLSRKLSRYNLLHKDELPLSSCFQAPRSWCAIQVPQTWNSSCRFRRSTRLLEPSISWTTQVQVWDSFNSGSGYFENLANLRSAALPWRCDRVLNNRANPWFLQIQESRPSCLWHGSLIHRRQVHWPFRVIPPQLKLSHRQFKASQERRLSCRESQPRASLRDALCKRECLTLLAAFQAFLQKASEGEAECV